jgi:hypothetical protein
MAKGVVDRVPAVVTRTGCRRQFSEEDKRRIIEESCRPGQSLSVAATPLRNRPAPIVPVAASPGDWPIGCADKLRVGRSNG